MNLMKFYSLLAFAALVLSPLASSAQVVIASNDFDTPLNLNSETITVDMAFMNFGDIFGVTNANTDAPDNTPFAVVDDSDNTCATFFPNDNNGVVPCTYPNLFFAMSDTENPNNMGPVSADWEFDISGAANLTSISIDMSAMGDFEASDHFVWSYSIDGGAFTDIFDMMANEAINATYTMADGDMFTYNDPMEVNGTVLLNTLTTFTANVNGSGNTLTLHLEGMGNGGGEAMAWGNIVIRGFAGGGTAAPTLSQWGMFLFALIMLSFGLVFMYKSQARMAVAGSASVSMNNQTVPFDKTVFQSALKTAMMLAILGFALIYMVWGEVVPADFIGMALSIPAVAYLIHMVKLFGKK